VERTRLTDAFEKARVDQRLLDRRERIVHHADDHAAHEIRLRVGGTATEMPTVKCHEHVRDRVERLTARYRLLVWHPEPDSV
jgi:hypothetical protein